MKITFILISLNPDQQGTQFITYDMLGDFLDALEEPLQIPKPNKYKIVSMDIPICMNDQCYCVEILDALTKDFFLRRGKRRRLPRKST